MKKRILYLDLLKCIAIVCVCAYHFSWVSGIEYTGELLGNIIWKRVVFGLNCVCVPLFFMVNGSLMFSKEYESKRWIMNILYFVCQLLLWRFISIVTIGFYNGVDCTANGMRYFANGVFFGEIQGINLSHMWFMYALVIVYLLFPFLKKYINGEREERTYLCFFMLVMYVLCFFTKTWTTIVKVFPFLGGIELENIRSFLGFDGMYGPMLFYFVLGGIIYSHKEKVLKWSKKLLLPGFVAGTAGLYIKWYYESVAINSTYDNVFWGYDCISGLLLTVSTYIFVMYLEDKIIHLPEIIKQGIAFIGRNTVGVYYLHWIIGMTVLPNVYQMFINESGLVLNLVKSLVLVVVCSIISEIVGKIPLVRYLFSPQYKSNER